MHQDCLCVRNCKVKYSSINSNAFTSHVITAYVQKHFFDKVQINVLLLFLKAAGAQIFFFFFFFLFM